MSFTGWPTRSLARLTHPVRCGNMLGTCGRQDTHQLLERLERLSEDKVELHVSKPDEIYKIRCWYVRNGSLICNGMYSPVILGA
jgi:hypothetical protein